MDDYKRLREAFIKRMTVDSETQDRRRKDYNQAIFHIDSKEEIDAWNEGCEKFWLEKRKYGRTTPVWDTIDKESVSLSLSLFPESVFSVPGDANGLSSSDIIGGICFV